MLTDWKSVALQLKTRSAAVVYAIQNKECVEKSRMVDSKMKNIESRELESQYSKFLDRLEDQVKTKTIEQIKNYS